MSTFRGRAAAMIVAVGLSFAGLVGYASAQSDTMNKDGMKQHDAMQGDSMKHDSMAKDGMKKDDPTMEKKQ